MNKDSAWSAIEVERLEIADLLEDLTEEQWQQASLCANWTVREVAGHLATYLDKNLLQVGAKSARHLGYDRAMDAYAAQYAKKWTNEELVEIFRVHADKRISAPGISAMTWLGDTVVHSQDIRRPLGIKREFPAASLAAVLDHFVAGKDKMVVPEDRLEGLRFDAEDIDWAHGRGAQITGSGEAVMMALAGRSDAIEDLGGEGVSVLASRL